MISPARIAPRATRAFLAFLVFTIPACTDKGAGVVLVESDAKPDRLDATATVLQGQNQQAEVGTFLGSALTVEVRDGAGMPMRGMQAVWTFTSGGGAEAGSVSAGQVSQSLSTVTDNQGRTSVSWRLGTQAGVQEATVSISTSSNGKGKTVKVVIEATALPGPATQLTLDPTNLVLVVRGVKALKAIASDQYGNAVAAGQVTWSSTDPEIAQVDSRGSVTGNAVGRTTITALDGTSAAVSSVEVQESSLTSSLSVQGGNGQTGTAGQALPVDPSVRVVDANGNPVPSISVGWAVTSGGGSVRASTTSTDASGVASVGWTLGTAEGEQRLVASLDGATAEFVATAVSQPVTNPATVNDLQVVSVTSTSVTLRWTQVDNGAGGAADYVIRSGSPTLDWAASAGSQITVTGTTVGAAQEYTWTGLKGGTAYQFGVAATRADAGGTLVYGSQSNQVSAFTSGSTASTPSDPGTVTDLQVVGITASSITLRWTQVDDGTGKPAKYAIRHGSPSLSWGTAHATEVSVSGTAIGQPLQYTFGGLSPATTYQFGLIGYRGTLNVDAVFGALSNFTSAGTSKSTVSGGTVSSVVASPSSATLSGIGSTKQLSALALDAYGNTLSGVTLQWQSLSPSIATVNGNGLVTAQALGMALIVVNASCCTAADTVGVTVQQVTQTDPSAAVWEDGFENGLSSSGGYSWLGGQGTSNYVTTSFGRTGSSSLAFRYGGKAGDLAGDGMSERRFTFGESLPEVWIEYWVWVPANYYHRDGDGPDNNKFMFLWDSGVYPGGAQGRLATMLSAERRSDGTSSLAMYWSSQDLPMKSSNAVAWNPALDANTMGRWNHVQIRVKAATGPTAADGVFQMWWDEVLRISSTALPIYDADDNKFRNGYLFGWANSGFDEETIFYIDDFRVFKTNPGW